MMTTSSGGPRADHLLWHRFYGPSGRSRRSRRCATAARSFIFTVRYSVMCLTTTARRSRWIASRLKGDDPSCTRDLDLCLQPVQGTTGCRGMLLGFDSDHDLYFGEAWFAALLSLSSASTFWSVFLSRLYPNPKIRAEPAKKKIGKPIVSQMIAVITFAGCVWLVARYPAQPRT